MVRVGIGLALASWLAAAALLAPEASAQPLQAQERMTGAGAIAATAPRAAPSTVAGKPPSSARTMRACSRCRSALSRLSWAASRTSACLNA